MTTGAHAGDGAQDIATARLAERFAQVFGHPPTPAELARFERARVGLELRLPAQVRRRAATVVANL
jgi:hypothetical protein